MSLFNKVGFLGPQGTFSHEAVKKYIKNKTGFEEKAFGTIQDLILAVQNDDIKEAVVPIENSTEGAVNVTLDALAFDVNLFIRSEFVLAIRQNLLAKKGTKKKDIKCILSHPQPIGQCRRYIDTYFPNAELKFLCSTADSAKEVAKGDGSLAAIGAANLSEIYDLEILEHGIQDFDDNLTRFVVLSKNSEEVKSRQGTMRKISLVFSTENKPGSLYSILGIFNFWDVNLVRIESRPAKGKLGAYVFFVDIEVPEDDGFVKDALDMIKRKTIFYKFLGIYSRLDFD